MAQTQNAMSGRDCQVEMSNDGTTFTDISGWSNLVEPDGGERDSEEAHTFDGHIPIVTFGKLSGFTIKVKVVYTEEDTDPVEVIRGYYEAGSDFYLRWAPNGGATGDYQYTTSKGQVVSPTYPGVDSESAAPMAIEFEVKCATISKAAVV